MKKLLLVVLLGSFPTISNAETEALTQIKRSPEVLCADNPHKMDCQRGVRALLAATNNLVTLNKTCEENKDLRDKMDDDLKYQCDSAREVS